MGGLLRANRDVVAKELGQTYTVKMKIDMFDHPLQLKPYRTSIHKRFLMEQAVKDMLKTGMIGG